MVQSPPPRPQPRGAPSAPRPSEHIRTEDLRAESAREPEHDSDRVRRRLHKADSNADEFYVNRAEIPDGLEYEWKRVTVLGEENPFYLAKMRDQGWEPVLPSRHPNWLPKGYNSPTITKGGQILMDRPSELSEEARRETIAAARQQVITAEQKLGRTPKDTMTRDFEGVRPAVVKEVGRMIPTGED
jgi:hypothetical protein